jgi:hypothetical protein
MPMEKFASAASAIAAAGNANVMSGRTTQMKPYPRKLLGISLIETDNTPVIGEETYIIKVGDTEVGRGRSILANTTGGEFRYPDDFDIVDATVPGGLNVSAEVTNGDAAAAHGYIVALMWNQL